MEKWEVGRRIWKRCASGVVRCGIVRKVTDHLSGNPWVVIKMDKGTVSGTQKTLIEVGYEAETDVDSLPAGRELDVLVAEKVMRYQWDDVGNLLPPGFVGGDWAALVTGGTPPYSTDIAAAWKVVEKLSPQLFSVDRINLAAIKSSARWKATMGLRGNVKTEAIGETAPLAICRAALKTISTRDA